MNSENKTSYTTTYPEVFLMCVENECCSKHWCFPIIKPNRVLSNNCLPSTTCSASGQLSSAPIVWSHDDEYCITSIIVAQTTPQQSDHTARCISDNPEYEIQCCNYKWTAGKLIQIRITTTLTIWNFAVHSEYRISRNGGGNKLDDVHCTLNSLMWTAIQCPTCHMVLEYRSALPMCGTSSAEGSETSQSRLWRKRLSKAECWSQCYHIAR
jgi:hypothetical protein